VKYTTIEPYAFGTFLLLSHAIFATWVSFSMLRASVAPGRMLPVSSNTAVRLILSTLIGYRSSQRTRAPCTRFACTASFTALCSASFLQTILTRCWFFGSTVTARYCYVALSCCLCIPFSTIGRIAYTEA
jgi:hypothetical protein